MLYGLILVLGIVGVVVWARFVEPYWIELRRQQVFIRDLPAAFDGFKITVLSDLHFPRWSSVWLIRRAIRLSNSAQPDIVLFAGDFCDRSRREAKVVPLLGKVLSGIQNRYGIFGVLGNHDHRLDADGVRTELQNSGGIQIIENRFVLVEIGEDQLAVAGIGDLWQGVVNLDSALSEIPPNVPRILLSHNPDVAERTGDRRIDLQVSGHTHGGQIRIPFGDAPRVPSQFGNKYRAGLVSSPTHQVYINRGICSMKRIRFWCRPEVTVLTLRRLRG